VTALLVNNGFSGFAIPEQTWTVIMLIVGTLVVALSIWRFDNPFIGLSVVWAFTGIMIKRQADYRTIFITAAVAMVLVAVVLLLAFFRKRFPGLA